MGRRHLDGEVSDRGPIEVGRRSFSLSVKAQVGLWAVKGIGAFLRFLTTRPAGQWSLLCAGLLLLDGLAAVALVNGVLLVLLGVWLRLDRESYDRRISERVRGWLRSRPYRRGWEQVLSSKKVNLTEKGDNRAGVLLPTMRHIRSSKGRDVLRVKMLPGQILEDWVEVCHRISVAFGCRQDAARVGSVVAWRPFWWPSWLPAGAEKANEIQLTLLHNDPLADLVEAYVPAVVPDFKALPIAMREDGSPFRMHLLGRHWLIVARTGGGKGSVLWSIISQLSGGVRSGLVRLVGLDPKGGVEFGMGRQVFAEFCRGRSDDDGNIIGSVEEAFAVVLERHVEIMRQRQDRMFGKWRLHRPTVEEPFIVMFIDELASLVAKAYQSDTEAGKRVIAAINILLSQGRAQAISIVAAVQDGRKESVPMRGLFTDRLGLGMNEAADVDLSLGDGARARGAWCDKIRSDRPGTAYVVADTEPDPVRMRFPFTTDDEIQGLPGAPDRLRPVAASVPESSTQAAASVDAPVWLPTEFLTSSTTSEKGDAA
jgi:S-DNA-T family DNA segregation ATPase FtsK/SpoIIIE